MDLSSLTKAELIKIIFEKDGRIRNLEAALAELKSQIDQLKEQNLKESRRSFKANKPKKAAVERKKREHGYSRNLDTIIALVSPLLVIAILLPEISTSSISL